MSINIRRACASIEKQAQEKAPLIVAQAIVREFAIIFPFNLSPDHMPLKSMNVASNYLYF